MSTNKEIMSLATAMREESTLSKRREAGRRLEERLSSARVRQQLAIEAGVKGGKEMDDFWKFIVQNSVSAVQKIAHSNSKLSQADILIAFSIIKSCDIPDETLTTEEARFNGTFHLARKEVRMVLNFCLDLLGDEEALRIAELDLLDMLAYLAGSRGYMAYLRSQNEMQFILEEVENRICDTSLDLDHPVRQKAAVRQIAAVIFNNLCMSTVDLGVEMTLLVTGCTTMVAKFCSNASRDAQRASDASSFAEFSPLILGLTSILRSNTEQAIAPLARHGRAILKLVKSCYRRVPDRGQRHVLNQYILCHLIVAQTAGQLSGLLPGDLGDLGDASLTPKSIDDLLQLMVDRYGEHSATLRGVGDLESTSLDEIQKTHLQLTARLMACAQRIALCHLERNQVGSQEDMVRNMIDNRSRLDDFNPCDETVETLTVESSAIDSTPFMKHILKRLIDTGSGSLTGRSSQPDKIQIGGYNSSITTIIENDSHESRHALLDPVATRTSLQILSACAEHFPTGACWASRSLSCWFHIPNTERKFEYNRHVHGSTPHDLATVVSTVTNILDVHGGHNGDKECQKWALQCLTRLAKSTSCLVLVDRENDFAVLGKAWQDAWSVLFRSDLRYAAYTANTLQGNVAELLLQTLCSIIQNLCTDPGVRWSQRIKERRSSFLYRKQSDLWNLPVFSLIGAMSSTAPFGIIGSLLRTVGLSEGSDTISQGLQFKEYEMKTVSSKTRRFRLINFCLCHISLGKEETMTGSAATALAALAHGHETKWFNLSKDPFRNASRPLYTTTEETIRNDQRNFCGILWNKGTHFVPFLPTAIPCNDPIAICSARLEEALTGADYDLPSFDFLASSQSAAATEALDVVLKHFNCQLQENFAEEDDTAGVKEAMLVFILRLKVQLTVLLSRTKNSTLKSTFNRLASQLADLFNQLSNQIKILVNQDSVLMSEVSRVVDFLVLVASSEQLDVPNTLLEQSQDLAHELEKWLESYGKYGVSEQCSPFAAGKREDAQSMAALDLDDDDLEDHLEGRKKSRKSRKRRRSDSESSNWKQPKTLQSTTSSVKPALYVARLLIALKPKLRTMRLVVEKLLEVDTERPIAYYDSSILVDPYLAACLTQLCLPLIPLQGHTANSGVRLICRLVLMTRRNAEPHSPLHLFGYRECALACFSDGPNPSFLLTPSDTNELLTVWNDLDNTESRTYSLRPSIRAASIYYLSEAFAKGGAVVREEWGTEYPKQVISSFYDRNSTVRSLASTGLLRSLTVLPDRDQIMNSWLKHLPPTSRDIDAFKDWYKTVDEGGLQGEQAWHDVRNGIEFFSLYSRVLLGVCSNEHDHHASILFSLLKVAQARDDLEPLCYMLTDFLASISGYGNAEIMIGEFMNGIIERWLERQPERGLLNLPILLSAPRVIRFLVRDPSFCCWNRDNPLNQLRVHAAGKFLARNSRYAIPRLLASLPEASQPDQRLLDFCSIFNELEPMKTIAKLIRDHVSSLTAYLAVMECISAESEYASSTLSNAIHFHLEDGVLANLRKRHVSSTAKFFIELSSSIPGPVGSPVLFSKIAQKFSEFSGTGNSSGVSDPFREVGLTFSECCVMSRVWTRVSGVHWLGQCRIQNIKILWSIVCSARMRRRTEMQLEFLFFLFSDLLSSSCSIDLLLENLRLLKMILTDLMSGVNSPRVSRDRGSKNELRVLFCSLLRLYEYHQKKALQASSAVTELVEEFQRRSRGLAVDKFLMEITSQESHGLEPQPQIFDCNTSNSGAEDVELMTILFEIMQILAENCNIIGIDHYKDLRMYMPVELTESEQSQLESLGHKQSLVDLGISGIVDTDFLTTDIYLRLVSKRHFPSVYHASAETLSPHQYLLLSELNELFRFLTNADTRELVGNDRHALFQNLARLCIDSPDEICAAASHCIGCLQFTVDDDVYDDSYLQISDIDDYISQDGKLEPVLQARCLELLVEMLKSPRVSTTLIAMETAKVLLSTTRSMENGELSSRHILHFASSAEVRMESLTLNSLEMRKIKAFFAKTENWVEWCWDEAFWASCLDLKFDEWICCLVPAIIACHFSDTSNSTTETARFISFCQRISYLEPSFAVALFPLLVVHLLGQQGSGGATNFSRVQSDTWVGDPSAAITGKISKCFASAIRKCSTQDHVVESRAVGLLIDTLDMIRRLEQHRFLRSGGHVRNPSSMKAFKDSASSNSLSQESPPTLTDQYPLQIEPRKWAGVPFGVGLFINGIELAQSCFKIKRYCSALFYAENCADTMFGGSTVKLRLAIEQLRQEPLISPDVSGFNAEPSKYSVGTTTLESVIQDANAYFELMVDCSRSLCSDVHVDALQKQLCDFHMMQANSSLNPAHDQRNVLSPSETLRLVDPHMNSRKLSQQNLAAFDCLSKLHLYGTLQASIEGFTSAAGESSSIDKLREKWFEAYLFGNSLDSFDISAFSYTQPSSDKTAGFCESTLTALLCFAKDDYDICRIHVDNARISTYDDVVECVASEASAASSSCLVDKLHCLNNLEAAVSLEGLTSVMAKWKLDGESSIILEKTSSLPFRRDDHPFSSRVRELVLQHLSTQIGEIGSNSAHLLSSLLWQRANKSCRSGNVEEAYISFQHLCRIHGSDTQCPDYFSVRHLEGRILESKGDFSSAIRHVLQSIDRLGNFPLLEKHEETEADLLICCGRWMAIHRVDSGENILEKFLRPGLELARKIYDHDSSIEAAERVTEACISLSDLVFSIYETVTARVKSPEWKTAGKSLAARETELKQYDEMMASQKAKKSRPSQQDWEQWLKDLLLYKQNLSRDIQQIRTEREKVEKSIDEYKALAIRTLIDALSFANDNKWYKFMSKYVYRIVDIWFSSWDGDGDPLVFDTIPSYRFVPMTNQLFSRLNQSNALLKRLARRLCSEHPYHCLSHMVRIGRSSVNERDSEKAAVAKEALTSLKEESPEFLAHLIENYEILLESYIYLAESNTEKFARGNTKKITFSAVFKGQATRLDQCVGRRRQCPPCVLTKLPSLRPRCDYGNGIDDPVGAERIAKFNDHFALAESGITRPKIVVCIGSKGGHFKQLVKGGDDCRGDAVMQQVFEYMNELFVQEKTGRDAGLRIVTYNIHPTSPTTGVLEWVVDTLPFGDYLNDRGKKVGAHSRYFPGEWGAHLCREYLKNAPRGQQKQAFETICKFHSPAFRFFFIERFCHSSRDWFEAKIRYTRSVAVSCFVGHILGIGDRHANNILVHQRTGEVVHIDFGIVFEQGKLLQVPERVPFRLTRNIVDGFGPTGIEGRFIGAARQTMKALKQNADSLLTILSAVTADPLYRWSVNPKVEGKRREFLGLKNPTHDRGEGKDPGHNHSETNESATQAVRKVKEKLSGYEDGTAGEQQSTEGQVYFLINLARDEESLSQMYPGWAPWS